MRDYSSGVLKQGAHDTVCDLIYREENRLADDDRKVAAYCRLGLRRWKHIKEKLVKNEYLYVKDGLIHSPETDHGVAECLRLLEERANAGRASADKRWRKRDTASNADNDLGVADVTAEPLSSSYTSTPTEESIDSTTEARSRARVNGFHKSHVGGNGSGTHFTIEDPIERRHRVEKRVAESLGQYGWDIVRVALDTTSPNFAKAFQTCLTQARKLGMKGLPASWPRPP